MTSRWALLAFPLAFGAVFVAVALALEGGALTAFLVGQRLLVRVIALVGCWAAVSVFERGDRLYDGWRWIAIGLVLVFLQDLALLVVPSSDLFSHFLLVLGLAFTLLSLAGVWRLASTWRHASPAWEAERPVHLALFAAAAVVALVAAGPGVWRYGTALAGGGDFTAALLFVLAVISLVALCLIAPLASTAWSLRGGLLAWPFVFLAASRLGYDAVFYLGQADTAFPFGDLFRGIAGNYLAAAGLAQYLTVREVRRGR